MTDRASVHTGNASEQFVLRNRTLILVHTVPEQKPIHPVQCEHRVSLKATFYLTISMRRQHATGKIQKNNYHHGSCGASLTSKTLSMSLIFTQGTHRNVKNR